MSSNIDCLRLGVVYGRRRQGKSEAKYTSSVRGMRDLARLEHIRELLRGRADEAALAIFSRVGFDDELTRAAHRDDVLLVTLQDMYELR